MIGYADNRILQAIHQLIDMLKNGVIERITKTSITQIAMTNINTVKNCLKRYDILELIDEKITLNNLDELLTKLPNLKD